MSLSLGDRILLSVLDVYRFFGGYKLRTAKTENERQQCHQFVKQVFEESGYRGETSPRMVPETGCNSSFTMVYFKRQLVGVIDVVRSTELFPLEYFFNIEFPRDIPRSTIGEVTHLAIATEHRKKHSIVSAFLFASALRCSDRHQLSHWVMCSPAWLRQGFRSFFRDLKILPEGPLQPLHLTYRENRENYFDERHSLQVYMIDLEGFSAWQSARELFRRRRRRTQWKRQHG